MATPQAQGIFEIRPGQVCFMAREVIVANGKLNPLEIMCNGAEYFCAAVLANNSGATLYLLVFITPTAALGATDAPIAFVKVDTGTTGFIEFCQGVPVSSVLQVIASTTPTTFSAPSTTLDAVMTVTYA